MYGIWKKIWNALTTINILYIRNEEISSPHNSPLTSTSCIHFLTKLKPASFKYATKDRWKETCSIDRFNLCHTQGDTAYSGCDKCNAIDLVKGTERAETHKGCSEGKQNTLSERVFVKHSKSDESMWGQTQTLTSLWLKTDKQTNRRDVI